MTSNISETFVDDHHSETVDDEQLTQQPTVDMGTPIDLFNTLPRLVVEEVDVSVAGALPVLRSQLQTDNSAVGKQISELRAVNSMPHLLPVRSDTMLSEISDGDTENWVPMVSWHERRCFQSSVT